MQKTLFHVNYVLKRIRKQWRPSILLNQFDSLENKYLPAVFRRSFSETWPNFGTAGYSKWRPRVSTSRSAPYDLGLTCIETLYIFLQLLLISNFYSWEVYSFFTI